MQISQLLDLDPEQQEFEVTYGVLAQSDKEIAMLTRSIMQIMVNLATQIELGHLDAVIVWDSVAAQIGSAGHVVPIPEQQNLISTAAVGVLKSAEYPELAEQFAEFLTSDRAKEVFAKHNYTTSLDEQAPPQ